MECEGTAVGDLLWGGTVIATIPLSLVGLLVNLFFIGVIIYGQYQGRLSGNLYYFLLNRAFGDIITSGSMFFIRILLLAGVVDIRITTITFFGLSFSFVASAVSYLSLSAIKLTAVKWPFLYRRYVTRRVILSILAVTWMLALLLSGVEATLLVSFFNLASIFDCAGDRCVRVLEILVAGTSAFIYVSVVGLYVWTVFVVWRNNRNAPRSSIGRTHLRCHTGGVCVLRLGANMLTYMVMCSLEAPGTWIAISLSPLYKENGNCLFSSVEEADSYRSTVVLSVICCVIFQARIIIDPIVNCIVDHKFRAFVWETLLCGKKTKLSRLDTVMSTTGSMSVHVSNKVDTVGQ